MKTEWNVLSKGKIKVPKKVREYFNLEQEDKIIEWIIDEENNRVIIEFYSKSGEAE